MARTPASNDAFFREVDDEVRRDRVEQAVRRYGRAAAIVVVVALLALGAYLIWQHRREAAAGENGERLAGAMAALAAGDRPGAQKPLDALASDDAKGYGPIARVLLADVAVQAGKPADAASKFTAVANDGGAPQPIRDLALVRATALSFDTLAPAEVIRRMKPLAVAGKPWFGSAGEMTALAEIRSGQTKAAGALLGAIANDPTVPQSIRDRVGQLAGDLGVEVVQAGDSGRS
ncbi:tetratricopeptide repeat protein [Sphingomonas sp.]|uniref:tetratricopeptide repeat protein n=1 Tax=Sphingomonas sp. TaxID=28214 RepID=UPI003AFFC72D